jgi:pimeloyl-ACP methyl ester carboxylesterase
MRHPFRTDLALPDIFCPLLILQHTTDQIAPITDGRMMKQLAAGPATLIELDGTHNALASQAEQERQERAIRQFLKLIQSNISY